MMRLTVGSRSYPLAEGSKIALAYDAADLADVQSGRSGVRLGVVLPHTAATARLFGNAADPRTAERFNTEARTASLRVDATEIFTGRIFLKAVRRNGADVCYEAEIVGNTSLWARTAALRSLADAGVEYRGALTPVEIRKSWTDDKPVKFLPVHRDSYELANSSVSVMPAQKVLMTDDYHPFISVAETVKAIFADAGYTVRSDFFGTEFFRSLYMSGDYSLPDASARRRAMDFRAGRTTDVKAKANRLGRVYASALVDASSVGNIADHVEEFYETEDGRTVSTGFYTNNRCFGTGDNGVAAFRPLSAVSVGFEYSIAYVTEHEIESRTRLKGFDTIHLGNGTTVPFTIANRYADHRDDPQPEYAYKLMIFEPQSGCSYRLTCLCDGVYTILLDTSKRMTPLTMPAAEKFVNLRLMKSSNGSAFTVCNDDWALYPGHVELKGSTEIEIKVRTPAEELSPSSPKQFNQIYFDGADEGMEFTLLKRTTLRPLFSGAAGYGSLLAFADIAGKETRQITLLEALQQMFALQFCTDERTKTVFIEPYDSFFAGPVVDWRRRIDNDAETVIADTSHLLHECMTLGYADGDGTVARFDSANGCRFGRWSFDASSLRAAEGESVKLNPLFAPTLNTDGKYADAPSALIMQVRDRDDEEGDDSGSVQPRIVRYLGMHPLAAGERWGYPSDEALYPLAAFHFAGDAAAGGFTLCFEERDGFEGLHRYHDRRLRERDEGVLVSLAVRLSPDEMAGMLSCRGDVPSVRSRYLLTVDGCDVLCTLDGIEDYDPRKALARCRFRKIISAR